MRLWHYKLLPYLPKSQLLAQWRELNSIFKKQDRHILINYVYEYPKDDLYIYSFKVMAEMIDRHYKIKSLDNFYNYFEIDQTCYRLEIKKDDIPFPNHHNNRYLLQCFYNLQEKFDRGQKDFTPELMDKLLDFIKWFDD